MKFLGIPTSLREVSDIAKAWLAISLAFAVLLNRGLSWDAGFALALAISAFTVGTGFLLHELAHKLLAQKYGCRAEFRSFDAMLVLAFAMSFLGFIFAAPGAVFITGRVNRKRNALISAAGPATNLLLAALFLAALLSFPGNLLFQYGFRINSWLALFNLIPLLNMDGAKVLAGNKVLYAFLAAASFGLMAVQSVVK